MSEYVEYVCVRRCKDCMYWRKDTLQHQSNDFDEWDAAECEVLAQRDPYNEIDHYVAEDFFCAYADGN